MMTTTTTTSNNNNDKKKNRMVGVSSSSTTTTTTTTMMPVVSSLNEYIHQRQLRVLIDTGYTCIERYNMAKNMRIENPLLNNNNTAMGPPRCYYYYGGGGVGVGGGRRDKNGCGDQDDNDEDDDEDSENESVVVVGRRETTTTTRTSSTTTRISGGGGGDHSGVDAYVRFHGTPTQVHLPSIQWNASFRKAHTVLMWVRPYVLVETEKTKTTTTRERSNEKRPSNSTKKTEDEEVEEERKQKTKNDDDDDDHDHDPLFRTTQEQRQQRRILYRLATAADDSQAIGVCVTCSEWKIVNKSTKTKNNNCVGTSSSVAEQDGHDDHHDDDDVIDNDEDDDGDLEIQTTLTAYSLPYHSLDHHGIGFVANNNKNNKNNAASANKPKSPARGAVTPSSAASMSFVQTPPITFKANQWHLIGFTHVHPYLKRPTWTVTIDGKTIHSGVLNYPVVDGGGGGGGGVGITSPTGTFQSPTSSNNQMLASIPEMTHCMLFHNIIQEEGQQQQQVDVTVVEEEEDEGVDSDDGLMNKKKAITTTTTTTTTSTTTMAFDFCSMGIYPVVVSSTIQSVVCEAGPSMCNTSGGYGRLIPLIPPVPNWSKGSTMDGPKVGIPMTVHVCSVEIQKLSSLVTYDFTIMNCVVLGTGGSGGSREGSSSGDDDDDDGKDEKKKKKKKKKNSRIICPMAPISGSGSNKVNRVGLITPSPPMRYNNNNNGMNHHGLGGVGTVVLDDNDDDAPSMYITGNCTVFRALSKYVTNIRERQKRQQQQQKQRKGQVSQDNNNPNKQQEDESNDNYDDDDNDESSLLRQIEDNDDGRSSGAGGILSVVLTEQQIIAFILLPFFLSLIPPGAAYELQQDLYIDSLKQLFALYNHGTTIQQQQEEEPKPNTTTASTEHGKRRRRRRKEEYERRDTETTAAEQKVEEDKNADDTDDNDVNNYDNDDDEDDDDCLAAQLIRLLASYISTGARAHEDVLQSGCIHVLASSLRLSLLRAVRLRMFQDPPIDERDLIRRTVNDVPEETTLISTQSRQDTTCPMMMMMMNTTTTATNASTSATSSSSSSSSSTSAQQQQKQQRHQFPLSIARACVELINACSGPPSKRIDQLSPAMQIRRTSDLALTVIFGLAFDWDLWGGNPTASAHIMDAIQHRYGGICMTSGYILRGQVSVQHMLDTVRIRLDFMNNNNNNNTNNSSGGGGGHHHRGPSKDLEKTANSLSQILLSMIVWSLANRRTVSQGEHDISACINALSDCSLGSVTSYIVLQALVDLLTWCDVFPIEASSNPKKMDLNVDEKHKMHVASRLGRNLLMAQFHDVVAPMILSRTVFSGERTMMPRAPASSSSSSTTTTTTTPGINSNSLHGSSHHNNTNNNNNNNDDGDGSYTGPLCWQHHWRMALLIFSWVASVAGPEGLIASKSSGSLMLASGLAGSLKGALDDAQKVLLSALFLPPPTLALMIGSTLRNEWSYTDLLSDRLQIMIPLLPGMTVALLSHPSDATPESKISAKTLSALSEILTAAGGAFHRVYGGTIHSTESARRLQGNNLNKGSRHDGSSEAVKAAKTYIPHLLVVSMMLEHHIALRSAVLDRELVKFLWPQLSRDSRPRLDWDSWVDVSSSTESVISEVTVSVPSGMIDFDARTLVSILTACQRSVMNTVAGLISKAMTLGGAGATITLLQGALTTLQESVVYAAQDGSNPQKQQQQQQHNSSGNKNSKSVKETATTNTTTTTTTNDISPKGGNSSGRSSSSNGGGKERTSKAAALAHGFLCRLISHILLKALKREYQWEVWSYELCSAVSRLCVLVEEKELITRPAGLATGNFSDDQITLIGVLVEVLAYGRDATGWCQLSLPAMAGADDSATGSGSGAGSTDDITAASKLLLPVLQPCCRIVVSCLESIPGNLNVLLPSLTEDNDNPTATTNGEPKSDEAAAAVAAPTSSELSEVSLISHIVSELDSTLTAAIVGLAFSTSRDTALYTLATLRKVVDRLAKENEDGSEGEDTRLCRVLFLKVTEELRARYESERRLRKAALFDAYQDGDPSMSRKEAAEASQVVERLILGGDIFGGGGGGGNADASAGGNASSHGVNEDGGVDGANNLSEDFVLFHEPKLSPTTANPGTKMGFSHYDGLGACLERCKEEIRGRDDEEEVEKSVADKANLALSILAPYLDAWDATAASDASETEIVKLFETALDIEDRDDGAHDDGKSPEKGIILSQQLPILGSETAADAMSTFFEFAAAERSRLRELSIRFLPGHRYSRMSFAERYCWARYLEVAGLPTADDAWERAAPDGNRDIRSRLPTVPCSPQFRRYIPKYLDHGLEEEAGEDAGSDRRHSTTPGEIGSFTKTLLETAGLEIVDVTKKEINEEEEPELDLKASGESLDEEDGAFFTESGMETSHDEADPDVGKGDEAEEDTATTDEIKTTDTLGGDMNDDDDLAFMGDAAKSQHSITSSAFATPPDNASSSLGLMHSAAAGMIEKYMDNCLHVKAEGSRQCTMLLTATHLILEYEGDPEGFFEGELLAVQEEAERQRMIDDAGVAKGHDHDDHQKVLRRQREIAALRPKSIRWNLSEVSHVYLRRYRLRDSSLEMFFIPSGGASFGGFGLFSPTCSLFLDFGSGADGNSRRNDAAFSIMKRSPAQATLQWPDQSEIFLREHRNRLSSSWAEGRLTNFDYLLHLNILSGRSYNDTCNYPVFPWVLSDYTSDEIPDLTDKSNFRDLSKPVGALNDARLAEFIERYETFADPSIPPFMYGSHYSTSAGVVLHFLVRLHPFAGLHRQLQSGHFDVADRLFSSVPRTWSMCTGSSAAEVKELTPEWYCNPAFLRNSNKFKLGTSQDGELMGDVSLPPWAGGSPDKFVEIMRAALESDVCSDMLPDWIDLIFGRKQQGPEAVEANNVFFYLTYYNAVDVASIKDEGLRQATELQIAHFGQCPMQLFKRAHLRRSPRRMDRLSFYQLLSSYCQRPLPSTSQDGEGASDGKDSSRTTKRRSRAIGDPLFLPFFSAPLSHWVHLDAPPPGPHASLVAVRFAGTDRCLAVDAKGVFHTFRWAWRPDEPLDGDEVQGDIHFEPGCFIAQRELARFRSLPRLMHMPESEREVAVAISKTLFAGRSVLLVLSDGDGRGGIGMQLVDPAKGHIRGEAIVSQAHAARITCIATDPVGTAAGYGGVGGELALFGSADGSASLWRFMSSHYLPLRPRVRLRSHGGAKVSAVALCSPIHLVATLSASKCCLFSMGNGTLIRSFGPPDDALDLASSDDLEITTKFADTPALAISVQGFVVTVCETNIQSSKASDRSMASLHDRTVVTLNLFTVEGISLGSKPLESWRGLPRKMMCSPDGTSLMVCCGRGVTLHRISACQPLEFLDEWMVTESDDFGSDSLPAAWDMDLGPSHNRPVVGAAACSGGVLRLHALPGISIWSERHKKHGLSETVGTALAKPAKRLTDAVKGGIGFGRQLAGIGREIGREVTSDVKERGVGNFFGGMVFRKRKDNSGG